MTFTEKEKEGQKIKLRDIDVGHMLELRRKLSEVEWELAEAKKEIEALKLAKNSVDETNDPC